MRPGRTRWLLAAVVWPALGTAQPTITSDGRLGTTVTQAGNTYTIGGGTVTGSNLFQSFDKFSVPTLGSAIFNGPAATQNVISRVTGGQLSSIDGTVSTRAGTSPMRSANFFFINPSGFSFGPNAKLDIGGTVHISTADNIQLSDRTVFSAKPAPGEVLTSAPPQAFGFLGNNPASIAFDHSQLSVDPTRTLSLIGGNVQVNNGALIAARGGVVQIVSVASPGNVVLGASELGTDAFSHLGQVTVSGAGGITVGFDGPLRPSGTVFIRSGELVVDGAKILSDSFRTTGAPIGLDIRTADSLTLRNGALLQTSSQDRANASGISIVAGDVKLSGRSAIQSIGFRVTGNAGAIDIRAASVDLSDGAIRTVATASGSAGDIRIKASGSVTLSGSNTEVASGAGGQLTNKDPRILAGNISIQASDVTLRDSAMIRSGSINEQGGESVSVTATNTVSISGLAGISSSAISHPVRDVTISAAQLVMDGGYINATTFGALGGGRITVNASTISLTNGAQIASSSALSTPGSAGSMTLNATGSVTIAGMGTAGGVGSLTLTNNTSSGLFSTAGGSGQAGQILVSAPSLTVADSARISVTTTSSGNAGTITANVGSMTVSGGRLDSSTTASGAGGAVNVTAGREVNVVNGGRISADSTGAGSTGNITVAAGDRITMNGGSISTRAVTSDGGDIALRAPQIVRLDNSQITTSVQSGVGAGGNIVIDPQFMIVNNSAITANAFGGPGGNITVVADNFIATPGALLQASSALSTPGTIKIVSPENNVAGSVAQLPRAFVDASRFLRGACSARREGAPSSFTLAGRGGVPADADGYLPSTIAAAPPAALALAHLDDCAR